MIKHIVDTQEFNNEIKEGVHLVDFFATWCGPCKMLTPVLEEADEKETLSGVSIIKIDVDQANELASEYHINAVPTLLLFKDGKLVKKVMGYQNINQLKEFCKI